MDSRLILKRVGTVLVIVGLIDIAVMIYCIAAGIRYSSSFNIFALIAGIFLIRGSLRAASIVRYASAFIFCGFCSAIVLVSLVQPIALTATQIRLNPMSFIEAGIMLALVLGLLLWVSKELGREEIILAYTNARRSLPNVRLVAIGTVGLISAATVLVTVFLIDGKSTERAKLLAQQELGEGYRFHVTSLTVSIFDQGKRTTATVVGWNKSEIKDIRVQWTE